MKLIFLTCAIFFLANCSKPKTVLICGDHVCINKTEAEQYFEENLTLEVKVINKKSSEKVDLIELNMSSNTEGKKEITLLKKGNSRKPIKILSNDEIAKKKIEINKKKKNKKKNVKQSKKKASKTNTTKEKKINIKKTVNKSNLKKVDICLLIKECNIDEVSKYLVKQGKEKKFPDITERENK